MNKELIVRLEHVAVLRVWLEVTEDCKITNLQFFNQWYVKLFMHFEVASDYDDLIKFMSQYDEYLGE